METTGWSSAATSVWDGSMCLTLNSGQSESHSDTELQEHRCYEHTGSQQWQCCVNRSQLWNGRRTWIQGQGNNQQEQYMIMLGPSMPTKSKLWFTESQDSRISPGMMWWIASWTRHDQTETTQYMSRSALWPEIELGRSPNRELCGRPSSSPTHAPHTTDIDWWVKPEARDPSQWQASNPWQQSSTDWRPDMCRLDHTYTGSDTERMTMDGSAEDP